MRCPECIKEQKKSKVFPRGSSVTLMYCSPFYDENGLYHLHDSNTTTTEYSCSQGHQWVERHKGFCWCGWQGDSQPEGKKGQEITYLKDPQKFWETHRKAREARNKKLANLSFSEKVDIIERLQMDCEILQNAKEQFGLGKVSNSDTLISDIMRKEQIAKPPQVEEEATKLKK